MYNRMWWNIVFLLITVRLTYSLTPPMVNITETTAPPNLGPPGAAAADERKNRTKKTGPPKMGTGAAAAAGRFTIPTTGYQRTKTYRMTFEDNCDYLAFYCLRAYNTGKLCGRTVDHTYHTFKNYCMLDYVNCRERFEYWHVAHMGECYMFPLLTEYLLYPYNDDSFLDQDYVIEDH